jgi:multidrug resistance protein, MATE family
VSEPLVHDSYRGLLTLAWPVVLSRASQAVIGFSDAAMVASLGEDAIAATTTGASNSLNLFILPMGVVFIVQSFVSQLAGAGDRSATRRYAWYGLAIALVTGVLMALGTLGLDAVSRKLGYTEQVRELLVDYMTIRLMSAGFVIGVEALGNWFGGLGDTLRPMLVSVLAMVANVFLNWVLIFGNLGAPALGVRGAALASSLSSLLAFIAIFAAFLAHRGDESRSGASTADPHRHGAELLRMLRFGLPNGVNWFLEFAAFTVFINVIVAQLGTTAVAAMMAVVQVNSIAFMPSFGISSAGAIVVGQAIGEGAKDRVARIVRRTMVLACGWQGFVGLLYASAPKRVMSVFEGEGRDGAALVTLGAELLLVSTIWQLFDAISISLSEALRAAGDTAWCMWARIVLAWFLFVPLSATLVLYVGVGPVGAITCFVVYLAVLAMLMAYRYRSGAWRNIDLTGREHLAH